MKKIGFYLSFVSFFLMVQVVMVAQTESWPVKAVLKNGEFLDVKAIDEDGNTMDVVAIVKEGDKHFMDVKVLQGDKILPVKMLVSNDYYVPVKAIGLNGKVIDVKAITEEGGILDVKGVSRAGNSLRIAAIAEDESFLAVKAVSPEGILRDVAGIKFSKENVEIEIDGVQVLAHVKALPVTQIRSEEPLWNVKVLMKDGQSLDVFAVDNKGNEHEVKAIAEGGNFHVLDIKAMIRSERHAIKLFKEGKKITMAAIDDFGRIYPIKTRTADGALLLLEGMSLKGNSIDIKAIATDGSQLAIKAISPGGDSYDVEGIKVKKEDKEGAVQGLAGSVVYYAHVKGLPPIQ